jgi:hypothetical protein
MLETKFIGLYLSTGSRDISVSTETRLRAGWPGCDSRQRQGIFFFATASRPALGPIQRPIQWLPGALSLGIKRPVLEADHWPPSSPGVMSSWNYTSTPPICLQGVVLNQAQETLVEHRDNFDSYQEKSEKTSSQGNSLLLRVQAQLQEDRQS